MQLSYILNLLHFFPCMYLVNVKLFKSTFQIWQFIPRHLGMHLWRTKAFCYKCIVPLSHPNKTSSYIKLPIIKPMFKFPIYTASIFLAIFPKPGFICWIWLSLFSLSNDFWGLISYSHFIWLGKLHMTSENFCLKLLFMGESCKFQCYSSH